MRNAINIGSGKQLFLDDGWFADQGGMTLSVNSPIKDQVVLAPEKTWDEVAVYAYSTVLEHEEAGLRLLRQRLDGFVSADATYSGAEFTTPLITFKGRELQLNVDCSALGQVWVEIRNEDNHVIDGYSLDESIDIDRNHIAAPVRWHEKDDVSELIGRPIHLHFKLRACKLYAFQFVDTKMRSTNRERSTTS